MKVKKGERVYGSWAGNPEGSLENLENCIEGVWSGGRGSMESQCNRKRGYGEDGLYCAQHAKKHPDPNIKVKAKLLYYANVEYSSYPELSLVKVVEEGPKTIRVEIADKLIGDSHISRYDRLSKPSKFLFDKLPDAIDYLLDRISKIADQNKKENKRLAEIWHDLERLK